MTPSTLCLCVPLDGHICNVINNQNLFTCKVNIFSINNHTKITRKTSKHFAWQQQTMAKHEKVQYNK